MATSECSNLIDLPETTDAAPTGLGGLFLSAAKRIRYRFFLTAGIFPYALGAVVASRVTGEMNWSLLGLGLAGVIFLSFGIEGINEHFDSVRGGDRVFASPRRRRIWWHLPLGISGFALALAVALYLVSLRGWAVLALSLGGGALACSYLVPPLHFSYRGLGETVIAIGYGPGLTLGSSYLQAGRVTWSAVLASAVPGLGMFAMALANEIPDYYGDRLVGKRNLIVRVGPRRGVILYGLALAVWFAVMAGGVLLGGFPKALGLCFVLIPLAVMSVRCALKHSTSPASYARVIRTTILLFVVTNSLAIISYALETVF